MPDALSLPDDFPRGREPPGHFVRRELDRANAEWWRWWGDKELVARIADASREAVEAAAGQCEGCSLSVRVGADFERFPSGTSFREQVTAQALREFETIAIAAWSGRVRADVAIRRYRVGGRGDLTSRVELLVTGSPEVTLPDLARVRDQVVKAVDRGVPAFGSKPIRFELAAGEERRISELGTPVDVWVFVPLAVSLLIAFAFLAAAYWQAWLPSLWLVAPGLLALLVASVPFAYLFIPSVALTSHARRPPLQRILLFAVPVVASTLIGTLVTLVLELVG
jgi:hypothetical protein